MRSAIVLWLVACSGDASEREWTGERPGARPDPVTVVETEVVGRGSVADVLVASATVESESSADLVPEATGVVREIRRDEGDVVEKGEILAVLDNVTLGTGAERATAEVGRLEQQLDQARTLLSRGAISEREVEDLEYQLRTAKLSSREARKTFGSTRLTAPFDGVVARRDVRVGELATSAKPAFQIVDPEQLRVVASVPERDLGRVAIKQPVRLVSAYDEDVWTTGEVARLAPVVDSSSGTFRVTVDVAEPRRLRPGQFVSVQIEVDRHQDVTVVPKAAVVYEDGIPIVYQVVDAPPEEETEDDAGQAAKGGSWWSFGRGGDDESSGEEEDDGPKLVAERHRLKLGLVDEEWAEVLEGIEIGDPIIVLGQTHLRDGARVRVVSKDPEGVEASAVPSGSSGEEG